MHPRFPLKEKSEEGSSSSSSWQHSGGDDEVAQAQPPRPMEGLYDGGPAPFLIKAFEMVDDLSTAHIISWSRGGQSFVVWDTNVFSDNVLPRYFKHSNFSSFVRQLNTYGFRKIDADKWEFANESFVRGQKHLLRNIIRRRRAPPQPISQPPTGSGPCVELGRFGREAEIDRLRRDKKVLMMELVKLRQQQQDTRLHLQHIESRLQGTEKKQQHMMKFMAKAMQNPDFICQLVQQKQRMTEFVAGETSRSVQGLNPIKTEPLEHMSELEVLALEMQGLGKAKRERNDEDYDKELDDGFWEELLNHGFDEGGKLRKNDDDDYDHEEEDADVNVLADRMGFLGSK